MPWSKNPPIVNHHGLIVIMWFASVIACLTMDGPRGRWAFIGILLVMLPFWFIIGGCLITGNCAF